MPNERLITYNGETRSITQWAEHLGILRDTLTYRIDNFDSLEDAFTRPVDRKQAANAACRKVQKVYDSGRKPHGVVWKHKYDAIVDSDWYPPSMAGKLTSAGTSTRAIKEGQFPIHTFEGGVKRVKGYDLKQWILKLGYRIEEQPKEEPKVAVKRGPYKIKTKFIPLTPTVEKRTCVNWPIILCLCATVGALLGWALSYVRC